ncbi:MAG: type II secretion system F family protein [Candidatus Omnitrophica bacterium]|nr:type II secretion system F family protein [Candidatus Omnitrophota bacterium]
MKYIYKARNLDGGLSQGVLDAETEGEAVQKILNDGLVPVEVDQEKTSKVKSQINFKRNQIRLSDLADFLRQFSDFLEADIPVVRALDMVEKRTSNQQLRKVIGRLLIKVQDGASLSTAFAAELETFPRFWSGLIFAGELSGQIKSVVFRLSQLVDKEMETRSRLISGAIYPLLILAVGILTVFVLLTFVVPKLAVMFAELGQELPLMTQVLLLVSAILAKTWWMIALLIVGVILWVRKLLELPSGKLSVERFLFRIPFWGEFMKTEDMERLARTIGILLESGVETVTALECGTQTLKRQTFKNEMIRIVNLVRQGTGLSRAFSNSATFSEDVISMINVGEESGRGHKGFLQWAQMCDRRLERMTKTATALIEPGLILLIGGVVGLIVMALLLPIFEMSLGKG